MESNAFKTGVEDGPGSGLLLGVLVLGLVAMVGAFALEPFGRPVLVLSWCFVLGGLALAVVPGRMRAVGFGLALAGVVPPLAVFAWLWLAVSVAALGGTVS